MIQTALLGCIILVSSCSFDSNSESKKSKSEDLDKEHLDNKKMSSDAQFLVNASEINLEEILLGKMAQQSGRSPQVMEFGRSVEDIHLNSQAELMALAKSKNIVVPTSPANEANELYVELKNKSTNDFDKAFADIMVKGHRDAINVFENASKECKDDDIKQFAKNALPELRKHLNYSIGFQKKVDSTNYKVGAFYEQSVLQP